MPLPQLPLPEAAQQPLMPNQQKYRPISFRPPEADRLWLIAYAKQTERAVNAILTEAVQRLRADIEQRERDQ